MNRFLIKTTSKSKPRRRTFGFPKVSFVKTLRRRSSSSSSRQRCTDVQRRAVMASCGRRFGICKPRFTVRRPWTEFNLTTTPPGKRINKRLARHDDALTPPSSYYRHYHTASPRAVYDISVVRRNIRGRDTAVSVRNDDNMSAATTPWDGLACRV